MENNNTAGQAQGAKPADKKQQAVSVSYTLKSQGENIRKLKEAGVLTEKAHAEWLKLHTEAVQAWTKTEFGL